MKIFNLTENSKIYTSNVYLILGTWNTLEDVNTLVDVGRDPLVLEKIKEINTGVGKRRVEQVILTHCHYDHTSNLPLICETYNPIVSAFSSSLKGVDHLLKNEEKLKIGDRMFEVIHTPCHTNDSICLYCEEDGVLFTGDTPVSIEKDSGTYEEKFIHALEKISRRYISRIYQGHGEPIFDSCNERIKLSLRNVRMSSEKSL